MSFFSLEVSSFCILFGVSSSVLSFLFLFGELSVLEHFSLVFFVVTVDCFFLSLIFTDWQTNSDDEYFELGFLIRFALVSKSSMEVDDWLVAKSVKTD